MLCRISLACIFKKTSNGVGIFGFHSIFSDELYFFNDYLVLVDFIKSMTLPIEEACIHPIHEPAGRLTTLPKYLRYPYEHLFTTYLIHGLFFVFLWRYKHPLFFFYRRWVPWKLKNQWSLFHFYQLYSLNILYIYVLWVFGPCECFSDELWKLETQGYLDLFEPEAFIEDEGGNDISIENEWYLIYSYSLIFFLIKVILLISLLYFFFTFYWIYSIFCFFRSFLFNKIFSISVNFQSFKFFFFLGGERAIRLGLVFETYSFKFSNSCFYFFLKILLDLISIVFDTITIFINLHAWYVFFEKFKFFEKYINFCLDLIIILTNFFNNDFFFRLLLIFSSLTLVNVFLFNTLHRNVYFASWRYFNDIVSLRKRFVNNFNAWYVWHHKSFFKKFKFPKFYNMWTVSVRNYHRRFHKWGQWNYWMHWFVKQKLKVKLYTKYFKIKINVGYLWTRHFFQYRSKHVRRRRRLNHNQYRRFLKEHRRFRWNSWLTKTIGSVGNPGRIIRFRKKCGYMRSRVYIRRSSTAIWMGCNAHFARDKSLARSQLYGYMRTMYWGKDSPSYHWLLIDNLYHRVFPNISSWSVGWLYPQADIFRWTRPYVTRNMTYYSSRSRCYDSFVWKNPYIFMVRYQKYKTWQIHTDLLKYSFEYYTNTFVARILNKYIVNYLWFGVIPTMSDIYDISTMNLENIEILNTDSFIFNFLKKF